MKRTITAACTLAASYCGVAKVCADDPTPTPYPSMVQTHLRLNINEDTKEVHYINTNNDPYVYTKVYVLKNADPYELRPYLLNAVGGGNRGATARRVNTSNTKVECIKYLDGTGMIIVSAEDYRFKENENGMSIDTIINILDQPNVTSSARQLFMAYFPKFRDATALALALTRSGMNVPDDIYELTGGKDSVRVDTELNMLMFFIPNYQVSNIKQMVDLYDNPNPEAIINYTIYEVDKEIDSQVGTDFQAWKNGPGSDLFAVGGRYSNGWNVAEMAAARPYIKSSNTRYLNFSPKWNTKYIDFLASKGHAKVMTSGSVTVGTSTTAYVANTGDVSTIQDGDSITQTGITALKAYRSTSVDLSTFDFSGLVDEDGIPLGKIYKSDGTTAPGNGSIVITEAKWERAPGTGSSTNITDYVYYIQITGSNVAIFSSRGDNLGTEHKAFSATPGTAATITGATLTAISASDPLYMKIMKDVKRKTVISTGAYGVTMSFEPTVSIKSTKLKLDITNTDLIGYNSNGTIRTSTKNFNTEVYVNNAGERFVIGGLDREEVIRGQSGLPWLDNIPGLGWLIGAERETHKKSQIIAIVECIPVLPNSQVPEGAMERIKEIKDKISNYGTKTENKVIDENDYGFNQFLFDLEKTSFDPLP